MRLVTVKIRVKVMVIVVGRVRVKVRCRFTLRSSLGSVSGIGLVLGLCVFFYT